MIELRTLGDCQIVIGDERLGPQSPYAFALALFLAMERGRPHSRDELLAMFSPGVPEANAAHSLRQTLYKLRQLGVPAETTPAGTLIAASEVRDDYTALLATSELPAPHLERLPGQFLPGYWPKVSDEFTRWLEGQRDAVNGALRRAYVSRILDRRAVARWDEVERFARACLVVDPLNEEATLALAEALALSGSKAAGVKVLDRYLEEVGREPVLSLPAGVLRKRISERVSNCPPPRTEQPMLGREVEMRQLNMLLGAARAGTQQSAFIFGEAGIGKSRLVHEFNSFASIAGARCIAGACKPPDSRRPMSVFADLAPAMLQLPGALGCDPKAVMMVRRLFLLPPDDVGIVSADGTPPQHVSEHIIRSLSQLIDAVTTETTLVIAIEDIHWADDASRHALATLMAERQKRRLLLIATSRNSTYQEISCLLYVSRIHLSPLIPRDARQIAEAQLATKGKGLEALADTAVRLAAGNPFAVISLALHYAENGDAESVPPHLQHIVEQQLQHLSRGARHVLLAAITLDKYATPHRIKAALQLPVHVLMAHLSELEHSGTLRIGNGHITLPHALVVACLVESEPSALALVQASAAEVLADEAAESDDTGLAWLAADLWRRAGLPEISSQLLRRCALHAINIGAVDEAVSAASRLRELAGPGLADPVLSEIYAYLFRAQHLWGRLETTAPLTMGQISDPAYDAELAILRLTISRAVKGSVADQIDWLKQVVQEKKRSHTARLRATVSILVEAEQLLDCELAEWAYNQASDSIAALPDNPDARSARLIYHAIFGDMTEALLLARQIVTEAATTQPSPTGIHALLNASNVFERSGLPNQAVRTAVMGFHMARDIGALGEMQRATVTLAYLCRENGELTRADDWIRAGQECGADAPESAYMMAHHYGAALRALDEGRIAQAKVHFERWTARYNVPRDTQRWALAEAIRLRIELEEGRQPSRTEIDLLAKWALRAAPKAPEDDVADAVEQSLRGVSSDQDARMFKNEYHRLRRPRVAECCDIPSAQSQRV